MLPQELLDEIVDWLADDRPSLIALSSTARCLYARSQALLFHEMRLSPDTYSPSSYIPLLEMSPHILTYVRRLRIVISRFVSKGFIQRFHVYEDDSLERLIHALMNGDDLELMGMAKLDLLTGPGGFLSIISSPKVRTVALNTAFLPNPQSLFKLLSYFPSVSSLHLENVQAMGTSPSLNSGNIFLTEISLSAGVVSSPLGVCLFDNAGSGWLRHLRSLIIDRYSARELFIVSELIPKLPNLVTLAFKRPSGDISHTRTQQRLALEIPVFPFQRIRSLHLDLYGFDSSWKRWWFSHLTQASTVSLEYLEVDFLYADACVVQPSAVDLIDVEIALLRLSKLKSVSTRTVVDGRI